MTRKVKNRDRRVAASGERQLRKTAIRSWITDETNGIAQAIVQEEDRDIIVNLIRINYESKGWRRTLDGSSLGIGRRVIGMIEAENNFLDGRTAVVTAPCFIEDDGYGHRWWRPLTSAETMALIVEEEM